MSSPTRVLHIAFEATDPGTVRELLALGHMPNTRALAEEGAVARVENPYGFSGAIWPSFATGVGPGIHGRFTPGRIVPGKYEVRHTPLPQTPEPFWVTLARHGRRVAVVDIPHTEPVTISGLTQVVEWGAHDRRGPCRTAPPELADALAREFGAHPVASCDASARAGNYEELRDLLTQAVATKTDLAEQLLVRGDWDLFVVGFSEGHCSGHQFWHVHDPTHFRHDANLREQLGDPVLETYSALDQSVGRLRSRLGDDTSVLVQFSHGMGPKCNGITILDTFLRRLDDAWGRAPRGVVLRERARRGARRAMQRAQSRIGRHSSVDRLLDGSRRFYRGPGNNPYASIRINLRGREPAGRIAPGAEYEETCAALERELLALADAETGFPIVRRVVRTSDVHDGPALLTTGDLIVEWTHDLYLRQVVSPTVGRLDARVHGVRMGDHIHSDGLLVARSPGLPSGGMGDVISICDLAPTLCGLLDVTLPETTGVARLTPVAASRPA